MSVAELRAFSTAFSFGWFGVDGTVTIPAGAPVETRVLWSTWDPSSVPESADSQRVEPGRVIGIRVVDVPTVPYGTVIHCPGPPETQDPAPLAWVVVGTERIEGDHRRVRVIRDPSLDASRS